MRDDFNDEMCRLWARQKEFFLTGRLPLDWLLEGWPNFGNQVQKGVPIHHHTDLTRCIEQVSKMMRKQYNPLVVWLIKKSDPLHSNQTVSNECEHLLGIVLKLFRVDPNC